MTKQVEILLAQYAIYAFLAVIPLSFVFSPVLGIRLFLAAAVAHFLSYGLKVVLPIPRPFEQGLGKLPKGISAPGGSFPSLHTEVATALAVVFFSSQLWFGILLILVAAALGMSRAFLHAHFVRDILGGAVLGVASAIFILQLGIVWSW